MLLFGAWVYFMLDEKLIEIKDSPASPHIVLAEGISFVNRC